METNNRNYKNPTVIAWEQLRQLLTQFSDRMQNFDAMTQKQGRNIGVDEVFNEIQNIRKQLDEIQKGLNLQNNTVNTERVVDKSQPEIPMSITNNQRNNESTIMNKKLIRLTESDLHRIVKESVNRVLTELDWKTYANAARKRALQGADDKVIGDLDAAANKGLEKYDIGSEQPLYGYKNAPRLKTTKQDSWGNKFARQELKMPEHERYSDNYSAYDHGTGFDGTADISLSKIGGNRDARKDIGDYFRGNSKYIKGKGWQ